jgi:hypothetical protein
VAPEDALIDLADVDEFIKTSLMTFDASDSDDILRRAIKFSLQPLNTEIEIQFISLYAALESALTFYSGQDGYKILPKDEFIQLDSDLRVWLKQHPLLMHDSARRGLIYGKIRELNRFPFSHSFRNFCARYALDLSDLWPVLGTAEEWPLMEIRHRLVHGDPFISRPAEAMVCAGDHLRWVVERMLLSILGWPIARSNVGPDYLLRTSWMYKEWQSERAQFA